MVVEEAEEEDEAEEEICRHHHLFWILQTRRRMLLLPQSQLLRQRPFPLHSSNLHRLAHESLCNVYVLIDPTLDVHCKNFLMKVSTYLLYL